jgi:ATP synthase protein I
MSEDGAPKPLAQLGKRLDEARAARAPKPATDRSGFGPPTGALGVGLRIGVELVAALCVGLALGWVFDRAFGTRPWGLIGFFFLGSAAGIMNVFRAARGLGLGGDPPGGGPQ